jgi:predicted branched-subunit amino acid permease
MFAGASQLATVTLAGTATWLTLVITASVINLRHVMYSAAMSVHFREQPTWFRWVGSFVLIDQMFALTVIETDRDPGLFRTYYLAAGATFWTLWQITTALGIAIGPVIPEEWNLGFAVPLLFIGLLVLGVDKSSKLVAALVGASVTFLFAGLPNRTGLLVGALAGIAIGTLMERLRG